MNILEWTDATSWNEWLVSSTECHSFLHSWEWGEMQKVYGRTVKRFAAVDTEGHIHGVMQGVVMPLPFGKQYLFSPRGPVVDDHALYQLFADSDVVRQFVQSERCVFWRFEPVGSFGVHTAFGDRVADMQPSTTRMLLLDLSEEKLLEAMKQKTRYNIRRAESKGVTVEWITKDDTPDWEALTDQLWDLITATNERHAIHSHPKAYYATMVRVLGEAGMLVLTVALHEGDLLAMNIMIQFGDTMTYLHGASSHVKKNLMAPYALQWFAIKRARQSGYRWYDFYGIAPEGVSEHPFAGVTRFKAGFGGEIVSYPGTFEYAFSALWYTIYRTVKKMRK